jgi:hypothetical protein
MEWVVNASPRPLYPSERSSVFIVQEETGWAPGPVCKDVEKIESLASTGLRTADRTTNSGSLYRLNLSCPNFCFYYANYFLNRVFIFSSNTSIINPYPANVENMVSS